MKISINRNILWADLFVRTLVEQGVNYACVSPGSRNTPLSFAFARNKKIKTFVIVDERSSAFFASGLARKSNSPVAVVTTSGTAVAELYPAIIEAYYQRIPLIICTADRPAKLRDTGANQTINQNNIYKNHIRHFADAGLPSVSAKRIEKLKNITAEAVLISLSSNRGPVHINMPFEKPFEPDSHTDTIENSLIKNLRSGGRSVAGNTAALPGRMSKRLSTTAKMISKIEKGLIVCGLGSFDKNTSRLVIELAEQLGYAVYADGSSRLRYYNNSKNILRNFTAFVRAGNFQRNFDPEIILQFGAAPTSNQVLEFLKKSKAEKILVNEWGDKADPSKTFKTFFNINPAVFCKFVLNSTSSKKTDGSWSGSLKILDGITSHIKKKFIDGESFPFEGRIINEVLNMLPAESNLFISNSMPIRDADFFAGYTGRNINIFSNRGASGIDGIVSSAAGISAATVKTSNVLITGDLAFYHDLNGIYPLIKYGIPLTIVLINNSGGGIFEMLPVSAYGEIYKDFFTTPVNIDFEKIVKGYGGNYYNVKSWNDLKNKILNSFSSGGLNILQIKTDTAESFASRKKYWAEVKSTIEKYLDENKI